MTVADSRPGTDQPNPFAVTVKNSGVAGVGPYLVVTEPTFAARFSLDPETDTAETVANVDVFVDLADGSSTRRC